MSELLDENWTFQRVAHRGFRAHYTENTIEAFQKALEVGATMLELDVRMTKDEKLVVLHDATLLRLGDNRRHVASMYWEELKEIDIIDKRAKHYKSGSILRLEELLDQVNSDTNYYIEIKASKRHSKEYEKRLCQKVVDLVHRKDLEPHVMYAAFEFSVLEYYYDCCDPARLGFNFKRSFPKPAIMAKLKKMKAILCPKHKLLDEESFQHCKDQGFRIIPWTVNETERMIELIDMGVDGITTDHPDRLYDLT